MEIVKQYLEKRIEQLQKILLNKETTVIHYREAYSSFKELEQVLTLFNEEYEKQETKISAMAACIELLRGSQSSKGC